MSESRKEMYERLRQQWRKETAQIFADRRANEERCPHRHNPTGEWAIGLQHNFPDRMPRGICLLCNLIIEPRHWASTGPNKVEVVPAHHLYPVVLALDKQDHALATLRDVYEAAVDSHTAYREAHLFVELDSVYRRARYAIQQQCQRDIADVSMFTGVR